MKYVSKEKEFILLIGQGLSIFGRTEMALGDVFQVALRTDSKTANRVFWSVNSLEVRTAMTAAALKSAFELLNDASDLRTLWTEIAKSIPSLASKRAELAHGNWIGMAWDTNKGVRYDQFFAPYYGKSAVDAEPHTYQPGYDPRPKKRLYIPDLDARIIEFSSLEMKLRRLWSHLSVALNRVALGREPKEPPPSRPAHPSPIRKKRGSPRRTEPFVD